MTKHYKYEYEPALSYFNTVKFAWNNDYERDRRIKRVRLHMQGNMKLDVFNNYEALRKVECASYYGATEYLDRKKARKVTGFQIAKRKAQAAKRDGSYLVDDPTLSAAVYLEYVFTMLNHSMLERVEPAINRARAKDWEAITLYDIVYQALKGRDTMLIDTGLYRRVDYLHNLHVSEENSTQIAYYPTLKMMRQDRPVRTTLGKYLTRHASVFGLSESEIKSIAEYYLSRVNARNNWLVTFETTKRGWIDAYATDHVRSCMKDEDAVGIYAHEKSTLKLACLRNGGGEVIGRCIVRDEGDKTGWLRVYPDHNGSTEGRFLLDYLKANGYENRTNLDGCLLDYEVTSCGDIKCPYLDCGEDGTQNVDVKYVDGKQYLFVTSSGDYCADRTDGVLENESCSCDCCGDRCDEDDLTWIECDERSVCGYCRDENYTYARTRHGWQYVAADEAIDVEGTYYYTEDLDRFDIYMCEVREEYYPMDSLCVFDEGTVHVDEAVRVDHPHDGNDYVHPDYVSTLSDGSTCHDDDVSEYEAEIAGESDDEDTEPKIVPEPVVVEDAKRDFEIGDMVRVLKNDPPYTSAGDVGVIIERDAGSLFINFNQFNNSRVYGDGRWWANVKNVELVK